MTIYFTNYYANETVKQNVNSIKNLTRLMRMDNNLDKQFYDQYGVSLFIRERFLDFEKKILNKYVITEKQREFFLKTYLFFWYHTHPDRSIRSEADELYIKHCKEYGFDHENF